MNKETMDHNNNHEKCVFDPNKFVDITFDKCAFVIRNQHNSVGFSEPVTCSKDDERLKVAAMVLDEDIDNILYIVNNIKKWVQ